MNMNMNNSIRFSFDDFDILGVVKEDVYLKGVVDSEDADLEDCVIVINRKLLHKSLDIWLNSKKDICDRYGHFCGVMGSIAAAEYNELGSSRIADLEKTKDLDPDTGDWSWENTSKEVKAFYVFSIEDDADMEHG